MPTLAGSSGDRRVCETEPDVRRFDPDGQSMAANRARALDTGCHIQWLLGRESSEWSVLELIGAMGILSW